MKRPASLAFQLVAGRGASARGRRPSLDRSSWPRSAGSAPLRGDADRAVRNPLSRLAAAPESAGPAVGPSRKSGAPEPPQDEEATP